MKLNACQRFSPEVSSIGWIVEPIKSRIFLEYGSSLPVDSRRKGVVPVYGSNGLIGNHDQSCVKGPGILVGRKGSVGEVHFSESDFWPIDTVYYVRRLRNDDWRFLYYLLGFINLHLLNAATGVPGLTRRDAHDILGAFPPVEEQRRIAAIIMQADNAIFAAQAELNAARELKRSLMRTLFQLGIPGRHKYLQDSKLGLIPKKWEIRTVRSVLAEQPNSGTSPMSRPEPPGVPILNVSCVKNGTCDPQDVTYVDVTADEVIRYSVQAGDFFVLRGNGNRDYVATGGLLRVNAPPNTIYSDKLIRLRFNSSEVVERFIPYLWQSNRFLQRLQSKAESGSGLWMISKREIVREIIAYPPLEEQEEIVDVLDECEKTLDALANQVDALQEVKRSLLFNLLTGKIRIPVDLKKYPLEAFRERL